MKRAFYSLLALIVAGTIFMTGCGSESGASTANEGTGDEILETAKEEAAAGFPAEYDGCTLDATSVGKDKEHMTVYATYTMKMRNRHMRFLHL